MTRRSEGAEDEREMASCIVSEVASGDLCARCHGVYFRKPHGFPVLCNHCWTKASPEQRRDFPRALFKPERTR